MDLSFEYTSQHPENSEVSKSVGFDIMIIPMSESRYSLSQHIRSFDITIVGEFCSVRTW